MIDKKDYCAALTDCYKRHGSMDAFRVYPTDDYPEEISQWLSRLALLYGVPLPYLLPHEQMLPPESIRFFYVDQRWIEALKDGALSVGRLTYEKEVSRHQMLDSAARPAIDRLSQQAIPGIRAHFLGLDTPEKIPDVVSGFILRSSVVVDYPGLEVEAYPQGGEPTGVDAGTPLPLLRMGRVEGCPDTLICLVDGEIARVDVHEPPEALHYGISRQVTGGRQVLSKNIYRFTVDTQQGGYVITMDTSAPICIELEKEGCFRQSKRGRVMDMEKVASVIGEKASPIKKVDASELGFEMIEGVGMVSFIHKTSNE